MVEWSLIGEAYSGHCLQESPVLSVHLLSCLGAWRVAGPRGQSTGGSRALRAGPRGPAPGPALHPELHPAVPPRLRQRHPLLRAGGAPGRHRRPYETIPYHTLPCNTHRTGPANCQGWWSDPGSATAPRFSSSDQQPPELRAPRPHALTLSARARTRPQSSPGSLHPPSQPAGKVTLKHLQ